MINFKMSFVALFLVYMGGSMKAQESQGDPYQYNPSEKMFLPTPEQASLMKFTNIPAGNHTGVFGYSVPIYTIQGKEFSLPISIDYHGMGIKVNEMASSVGIGWALNVGGISLSQEVRGERDQSITRLSYFNPDDFTPIEEPENQAYRDALGMLALSPGTHGYTPAVELHPDYYSYSLLHNKGKFMLDNGNKAHTIPKDNVKIQGSNSFILTDSKGLIYHFSVYQQENATYGNDMNHMGGIVENRINYGHKIDYIEIPHSGETISFDYYKVSYGYFSSHTVTNKIRFNLSGNPIVTPSGSNTYGIVTEYLPKTIIYKNTKVEFKYKMNGSKFLNREDVDKLYDHVIIGDAGGILESIEVSDFAQDLKIKDYQLTTDYFISVNESLESLPDMANGYDKTTWRKRLKLEELKEIVSDTNYVFEYYGEDQDQTLPPRFSYNVDFWGMYNGKNNSRELPTTTILHSNKVHFFYGADKNPDINFAQIGSLKKIKLPTGGSQLFEYELDEFKNTIFEDDDTNFHPVYNYQEREYTIDQSIVYNHPSYDEIILNITPPAPDFRDGIGTRFQYYTGYEPPSYDPQNGGIPNETCYYAQVFENNVAITARIYVSGEYDLPQLNPANNYSLRIFKHSSNNQNVGTFNIQFTMKWIDENATYPKNRQAGSLRVKSITLNDTNGAPQIKRSYSYQNIENESLSSGIFTGRQLTPFYLSDEPNHGMIYNITNNDIYNLTTSFGKSVVYENVTETYESTDPTTSSKNHTKEYVFSLPEKWGYPVQSLPLSPFPNNDFTGGLLLEERIKDNLNRPVRITRNQYNLDNPDFYFNSFSTNYSFPFTVSPAYVISKGSNSLNHEHPFHINYYHLTSAWIKLLKTTVDEYENGNRVRTNFTEYAYNEGTGLQNEFKSILPVLVTTGTSMAKDDETYVEKIKTVYKYPQDLTGGPQGSIMQTLKDANRISEPIKTEKILIKPGSPDKKLSELYLKYGANLLPSEVHYRSEPGNIDINTATDRKVRYSRYDNNGNIEEFIMENGTPVSIVWGYNKQFPIAKVEGVPYSVVGTYTTNIVNDSNSDTTNCIGLSGCNEATLRVSLNNFRKQSDLSEALITTYTYDPLVGVTSITQPNGQVEYYKYDNAGRLELIYDKDLNVIKNMRYNYKD